MCKS
jgi:hypothetical protein